MVIKKIPFESIGAIERDGHVVIVAIERFTEDRIEFEIGNPFVADDLAEEIIVCAERAAKRLDGDQ